MSNQRRFALIGRGFGSDAFDEAVTDLIGGILTDSTEIDFTYTDATPSITAALKTTLPGNYLFSGNPKFTNATTAVELSSASPQLRWTETDAAANNQIWNATLNGGVLRFKIFSDDLLTSEEFWSIGRTGTNVDGMTFTADITVFATYAKFTGQMEFNSTEPIFLYVETGGSADEGIWAQRANSGTLSFETWNDTAAVNVRWLTVERTGTVVDEIQLDATLLDFNGNLDVSGTAVVAGLATFTANGGGNNSAIRISAAQAELKFYETDGGTDEKLWGWVADGSSFGVITRTDAGTFGSQPITISRLGTGTTVNTIAFTATAFSVTGASTFVGALDITPASGNALLTGTGSQVIYSMVANGASSDEKWWRYAATNGGQFIMQTRTDANATGADFMIVDRTGTTVDAIQLLVTGTLTISGSGETLATFADDGAVTLYHNNTSRIATSATGVDMVAGTFRLFGYTVATLPAGTVGQTAYVTDALAPAFLTAVVGGGAVKTPVFYDGTNWVAM